MFGSTHRQLHRNVHVYGMNDVFVAVVLLKFGGLSAFFRSQLASQPVCLLLVETAGV